MNALTKKRSIKPRRGSGFADATTMSSWSILATMVRSSFAASSTVRLSEFFLSLTFTIRARVPSSPEISPTISTESPTTTDFGPSSRAFIPTTTRLPVSASSTKQPERPRSTEITREVTEESWEGRSLLRRRVVRDGRMRASDSSYSRGVIT